MKQKRCILQTVSLEKLIWQNLRLILSKISNGWLKSSTNQQSVTNNKICADEYTCTTNGKVFPGGCLKSKYSISVRENISLQQRILWKSRFNWSCYKKIICCRKVCPVHQYQWKSVLNFTPKWISWQNWWFRPLYLWKVAEKSCCNWHSGGRLQSLWSGNASKESKTDSEEHYFCFDNFSERAILNFTETHVCNQFHGALGFQWSNAQRKVILVPHLLKKWFT